MGPSSSPHGGEQPCAGHQAPLTIELRKLAVFLEPGEHPLRLPEVFLGSQKILLSGPYIVRDD